MDGKLKKTATVRKRKLEEIQVLGERHFTLGRSRKHYYSPRQV